MVLIPVYPITWLIYTELIELPQTLNPPAIRFLQFHLDIVTPFPWRGHPLSMSNFIPVVWFTPHLAYIHGTGRAPLNFEPFCHPFTPNSPQYNNTYFLEGFPLSMSDFITVVGFIPRPCGTHFRFLHHLAHIHWTGRAPLHFEPFVHPFPTISPQNIYSHFIDGSPLSTPHFITVVCFTPKPCGTHFRLPLHLAYIHWTGTASLKFEPSGHPFHPTTHGKMFRYIS